jgi:hypothetical protein
VWSMGLLGGRWGGGERGLELGVALEIVLIYNKCMYAVLYYTNYSIVN